MSKEFLIKCIVRAAEELVYLCVNTTYDTINVSSDAILRLTNASNRITICDYDATFLLLCYNVYIALNNYMSKIDSCHYVAFENESCIGCYPTTVFRLGRAPPEYRPQFMISTCGYESSSRHGDYLPHPIVGILVLL